MHGYRERILETELRKVERDIPALGPAGIPIPRMETLWHQIAHLHGQTVNYSKLADAIDVAVPTLKGYLSLLEQTFMIRLLPPLESNLKNAQIEVCPLSALVNGIYPGFVSN